ncbi:acyltransferase family protein [Promicromonospora thailandica]|uniref:acyltransferase family protein n=1 Tax=Promicromonospora thailandica TaxID=765201 RepID=UPI0020A356CA|nr:acyltransferase [Promicromonospora thailandica]
MTTEHTVTTTAPPRARTRLGYIDNLRILLAVLVLAHHAALTYGALPIWYWTEPSTSASGLALMAFVLVTGCFRMGFFFMIAGLFVAGSVDRKGGGAFVRDRLVRLGVPLIAFTALLRPLLTLHARPEDQPLGEYWFSIVDPGPLWFVEVLLVMSLAYVALRWLRTRSGGPTAAELRPTDLAGPVGAVTWRRIGALVGLLTVTTFLWRLAVPLGTFWEIGALPTPASMPQYVTLFTVGVLASRRGWLAGLTARQGRVGLVAALVTAGPLLVTILPFLSGEPVGLPLQMAQSLLENVFAVGMVIGLLVLFRDKVQGRHAWVRSAGRSSYAVYVIHPVVLVGVAMLLAPVVAPAGVRWLLLLALAVPLCWLLAGLLRKVPGVSRVL